VILVPFHYPGNQDKNKVNKAFKDKNKFSDKNNLLFEYECVDVLTSSRKEGYRTLMSQCFLRSKDGTIENVLLQLLIRLDPYRNVSALIYDRINNQYFTLKGASVLKDFYCDPEVKFTEV
jgi:hypothetical protein